MIKVSKDLCWQENLQSEKEKRIKQYIVRLISTQKQRVIAEMKSVEKSEQKKLICVNT